MEKIEKDGCVAVLYSPGYGVGRSTWADDDRKEALCMDARVLADRAKSLKISLDQKHAEYEDMKSLLLGNARNLNLEGERAREHLRLAIDHIAALNGALEDLASLGATIAICGTKYDDAAARKVLVTGEVIEAKAPAACDKDPQGCWNIRCQLGERCCRA